MTSALLRQCLIIVFFFYHSNKHEFARSGVIYWVPVNTAIIVCVCTSMIKHARLHNATTDFPAKMASEKCAKKFHTDDKSSFQPDWLRQISQVALPIRSATQICVVTHHQYGNSLLISQKSFPRRWDQWWHRKTMAVSSGYVCAYKKTKQNVASSVQNVPVRSFLAEIYKGPVLPLLV